MRERQAKELIKLRLLALVLALALTWYSLNPAPGSMPRAERDDGQPDEKRHEKRSRASAGYDLGGAFVLKSAVDPAGDDVEDLEWPEVIDFT